MCLHGDWKQHTTWRSPLISILRNFPRMSKVQWYTYHEKGSGAGGKVSQEKFGKMALISCANCITHSVSQRFFPHSSPWPQGLKIRTCLVVVYTFSSSPSLPPTLPPADATLSALVCIPAPWPFACVDKPGLSAPRSAVKWAENAWPHLPAHGCHYLVVLQQTLLDSPVAIDSQHLGGRHSHTVS